MTSILKKILFKIWWTNTSPLKAESKNYTFDNSSLGEFCKIGDGSYLFNSAIGDYTYLSKNVTVMNCSIGKFCSIAQGACISLGRHPTSKFVSTHPSFFSPHRQNGMTFSDESYFDEMGKSFIGNDVWIGVNAVIMDDVIINNGAIIGAGAVVTKDIPPYAIAIGVPAKIIRYRFNKDEIDFLEKYQWWNKGHDWLQANFKDLHDIKLFMEKHELDPL